MKKAFICIFTFYLLLQVLGCATNVEQPTQSWNLQYSESIQIKTEPSSARIYLQDVYIGTSPIQITTPTVPIHLQRQAITSTTWRPLSIKPLSYYYKIMAVLDGYKPEIQTITLNQNSLSFKDCIQKLQPTDDGQLPPTIEGKRGIVLILSPIIEAQQPQPQQQQQQQTVVIPGNLSGTTTPASEATGTVMVSSNVQGADVYVDGIFVGNAPANLKLKDGIHIIEVKKSGYTDYRRELRVYSNSELSLRADLNSQ